jgi:hypothetical protein
MLTLIKDEGSHLPNLMGTGSHLLALGIPLDLLNVLGSTNDRRRHCW